MDRQSPPLNRHARRVNARAARRAARRATGSSAPLPFTISTREIGGKLLSHIVLELPAPPTDDQESAIDHASVEGEQASPEFLRMVAAWEASQGEETPELEAATAALVSALGRRPCPCGSGHLRRDCCGK